MLLKELCDKYDIKLADMANCIGLSISTLRNNASKMDTTKLSIQQVKAIYDTFGIKFNDIIGHPIFHPNNIGNNDTLHTTEIENNITNILINEIKHILKKYDK